MAYDLGGGTAGLTSTERPPPPTSRTPSPAAPPVRSQLARTLHPAPTSSVAKVGHPDALNSYYGRRPICSPLVMDSDILAGPTATIATSVNVNGGVPTKIIPRNAMHILRMINEPPAAVIAYVPGKEPPRCQRRRPATPNDTIATLVHAWGGTSLDKKNSRGIDKLHIPVYNLDGETRATLYHPKDRHFPATVPLFQIEPQPPNSTFEDTVHDAK
ncbi:hypothetical protein FRC00_005506 [Tulasnella sp. 408]|nr:hypothetical protein FRC00_005506 [Tulasnella sp. 408]